MAATTNVIRHTFRITPKNLTIYATAMINARNGHDNMYRAFRRLFFHSTISYYSSMVFPTSSLTGISSSSAAVFYMRHTP